MALRVTCIRQIHDAENGENFIYPGRHDVQQRRKEPPLKGKVQMHAALLAALEEILG